MRWFTFGRVPLVGSKTSFGVDTKLWKCKDGKYRNYLNTAYEKQPWEVEVSSINHRYKMQGPLTKAFMEEYGVR